MRPVTTLIACVALLVSGPSFSCGESLYRVGKGISYREYVAPLPGRILVVLASESEREFISALERAGHDVDTVASVGDVAARLASGHYDIVMSHYGQYPDLAPTLERSGNVIAALPVASGAGEIAGARAVNRHAPMSDDTLKQFLKAIHRTMKDSRA